MSTPEAVLVAVIGCPLVIGVLAGIIGLTLSPVRIDLRTRRQEVIIARLERNLDLVMRHLGIEEPDTNVDPVLKILAAGNKIALIKIYREQTGAGLKDAKDAVEAMRREMGIF